MKTTSLSFPSRLRLQPRSSAPMLQPMPELLEKMFWKVDFKVTGPSDPLLDEMLLPELRYLCSYRTLSIKLAIWGHGL